MTGYHFIKIQRNYHTLRVCQPTNGDVVRPFLAIQTIKVSFYGYVYFIIYCWMLSDATLEARPHCFTDQLYCHPTFTGNVAIAEPFRDCVCPYFGDYSKKIQIALRYPNEASNLCHAVTLPSYERQTRS